jgi:hypothetical protein
MPAERTTMRRVREVLRLKFVGRVLTREIALVSALRHRPCGQHSSVSRSPAWSGRCRQT